MKNTLLFLLLAAGQWSTAQNRSFSILGKVVDSATLQPMAGASAFCPNTTHGTITNSDGLFFLRLPAGGYDLVVSFTGYEKAQLRLNSNDARPDTMLFYLRKEETSMAEVAVVASTEVPEGFMKYGHFFLDLFIGTSPNASQCVLENPEALHFYFSKKRNRLKVVARYPLFIQNYALGYRIQYQLDSFSYDYNTDISQYTGFPLFSEMDSTDDVKARWAQNRAETYLGSRLHFMRSLYDSTMKAEGFYVEILDKDSGNAEGTVMRNPYDSSLYQNDSNLVYVNWQGRYRICYWKVKPDPQFLESFHLPLNTSIQPTLVDVDGGFVIQENGYFFDQYDVINTGYWAWKKLAELLPYDYNYQ